MAEKHAQESAIPIPTLASALMYQDRHRLIPYYLILLLPQFYVLWVTPSALGAVFFLERFCQLIFLFAIGSSWLTRLSKDKREYGIRRFLVFMIYGYVTWLLLLTPLLMQFSGEQSDFFRSLGFFLLIPAIVLLYRYFFYFFPILNGIYLPQAVMRSSLSINTKERFLPVKTLLAPLGWFSLIAAAISALSPDGRVWEVSVLLALTSGIFWFLHCYLALAASLIYWSEKDWNEAGLAPYRNARLGSLLISAPRLLSGFLAFRKGQVALLLSLLLWFANLLSLESMQPAAKITLSEVRLINDNTVVLDLSLHDSKYLFRGFQPARFSLAGEQGMPVSEQLSDVTLLKGSEEIKSPYSLPESTDEIKLRLKFLTTRKGEALKSLQDIHLWYRSVKLFKIDLAGGTEAARERKSD